MSDVDERRAFAVAALTGVVDDIDLAMLDPADPDERHILIEAEHPELRKALESDLREVHIDGQAMNPTLHIAMHEIVANQLWDDDPPEVWQTAKRLTEAGYARHEVLHMLASVVSNEVFDILANHEPADLDRMRAELAALPGSWERQRDEIPQQRHLNRAERRAAARKRPR